VGKFPRPRTGLADQPRRAIQSRFTNRAGTRARSAGAIRHRRGKFPADRGRFRFLRARPKPATISPCSARCRFPPNAPFENDVYQAGFDASWEIDVFGGTRRAAQSARAEVGASEFGRRDTLVTLLGEVARNYVDVRGFQRRIAIANENIAAQTNALAITQDRFAKGLTSDLDVQQASTLLATTKAEIPTLQTSLQSCDSSARRFARPAARRVAGGIVHCRAHSRRAAGSSGGLAFRFNVAPPGCATRRAPTRGGDREHRRGQGRFVSEIFPHRRRRV
jgi:hypothetical protein